MNKSIPIYEITLPNYTLEKKPDYEGLGSKVDRIIKEHFLGQKVCIRALSSADHPNLSVDELIKRIQKEGTDKYDPKRKSFWHEWEVYKDKGIEMFACCKEITREFKFMHEVFGDFYEGAVADRGYAVRVEVILIYDPEQLEMIPIQYSEHDVGEDAWKFKNPHRKKEALKAIIKVL